MNAASTPYDLVQAVQSVQMSVSAERRAGEAEEGSGSPDAVSWHA